MAGDPRKHPVTRANIWKPGQSGNPKGRPKRKTLEATVNQLLDQKIGTGADSSTRLDVLAAVVLEEVMGKRNTQITRALLDRLWPTGLDVNLNAKHQISASDEELVEALSQLGDDELAKLEEIQTKLAEAVAARRGDGDDG